MNPPFEAKFVIAPSQPSSARPRVLRLLSLPFALIALLLLAAVPPARGQAGQTISVANGNVAGLITAIQTLNADGGGTIDLASNGTYSVSARW